MRIGCEILRKNITSLLPPVQPMIMIHPASSASGSVENMDFTPEGENTDYSTTSSPVNNSRRHHLNQDDSLSDEDDLSDEFSLMDSDEERRADARFSHHVLQVC